MLPIVQISPEHLLIAPLLIPFAAGVLMLFYDDRRRWLKFGLGLASVLALAMVSWQLLDRAGEDALLRVYLLGNWPVPMGIVLVLDRLSALMVMLTAALALPALIFAAAGSQGQGQHFHSLFQFLLFGLNGAFLTGDLFNLFVFFEVMLAASYGLVLHGSGVTRIRAGLHYIAINLTASLLFLIGVALIYGVTGTLNMAQLGQIAPRLGPEARPLFHAGAAILGVAFLIKAAMWPMGFWLARTYAGATPPVGAMMTLMSKVGVYAILRLAMMCFSPGAGDSAGFGAPVLLIGGMLTMFYGALGVLSSDRLAFRAGHVVLISSGTLLSVIGIALLTGGDRLLGGALFYMVGSTLGVSALYLIAEIVDRRAPAPKPDDAEPEPEPEIYWGPMGLGAVEDDEEPATALPASLVTVGALFAAITVILAGLPPFSGFIGKFAMISGAIAETNLAGTPPPIVWLFVFMLLASGFAVLIALMRFGMARFWVATEDPPRILALEVVPVVMLLAVLVMLSFRAEPAMRLTLNAADSLLERRYAATVMSVRPVDPGAIPETETRDDAP